MKSPLYIELYGLPGSGKSTLSHIVAKRLRSESFSVEEPSYDIDHQHPLPKKIKKFAIGCLWVCFHHQQYKLIKEIVEQNGYRGLTAFTMTVNIIQKMRIYNRQKSAAIVIMDQGLIQACVSLSTNGKKRAIENYEKLLYLMPNAAEALRIYIDVDNKTAIERMSKRISNDSRIEKLKDHGSKLEMLQRIRQEMVAISEKSRGNGCEYVIMSTCDWEKDAECVYDAIDSFLNKSSRC